MIKIYGSPRTSAGRCFLMLEESGAPYTTVALDMMEKKEHRTPEYLKLNPNGKVPCLVDGEFVIWESLAINFYLAEKYRQDLLGRTPEENGLVHQWSIWGLTELQAPLIDLLIQMLFVPEPKRDANIIAKAKERIPPLLEVLNQALGRTPYVIGDQVSLADINLVSVANIAPNLQFPLDGYAHLCRWMNLMRARPSFQRFLKLRGDK